MEVPLSQIIISSIIVNPLTPQLLVGVLVLVFLLSISAFVSGAEVAFFSLNPQQKESLKITNKPKERIILQLISEPEKLLATILIVNNLVNVGIVILSSFLSNSLFNFGEHSQLGFLFQIVVITFILLLFGEILPKVYASRYPIGFSKITVRSIQIFNYIFSPFSFVLTKSSDFIQKHLSKKKQQVSIDELSDALDLTEEDVKMDDKILKGIMNFANIGVSEIMRSRMDVITINIKDPFSKVIEVVRSSGYSRIPVIDETFDNIRGILYVKDLLPHVKKSKSFRWQ